MEEKFITTLELRIEENGSYVIEEIVEKILDESNNYYWCGKEFSRFEKKLLNKIYDSAYQKDNYGYNNVTRVSTDNRELIPLLMRKLVRDKIIKYNAHIVQITEELGQLIEFEERLYGDKG